MDRVYNIGIQPRMWSKTSLNRALGGRRVMHLMLLATVTAFNTEGLHGRAAEHAYHWHDNETGEYVSLHYKARHPEKIRIIKLHEYALSTVICSTSDLSLAAPPELLSKLYTEAFWPGTLIVGGPEWNCSNGGPILRRLITVHTDGITGWLNGSTEGVSYAHVFSDLDVTFTTNIIGQSAESAPTADERPLRGRAFGWWANAWNGITQTVTTTAQAYWQPTAFVGNFLLGSFAAVRALAGNVELVAATLREAVIDGSLNGGEPLEVIEPIGAWSVNIPNLVEHLGRRLTPCPAEVRAGTHCAKKPSFENLSPVLIMENGARCEYTYAKIDGTPLVQSARCTVLKANFDRGQGTVTTEPRCPPGPDKCAACPERVGTRGYARTLGQHDGCIDDDAGHILAKQLGGCGDCPVNIFPQNPDENRLSNRKWRIMEEKIAGCLRESQDSTRALISWTFLYASPADHRPARVRYSVAFSGTAPAGCSLDTIEVDNQCRTARPSTCPLPHPPPPLPPLSPLSASTPAASDINQAKSSLHMHGGVQCSNCFAYATADVRFRLQIRDHEVQVAEVFADGSAKVTLEATASSSASYHNEWSDRNSPKIPKRTFPLPTISLTNDCGLRCPFQA